jgi:hypothetical protein
VSKDAKHMELVKAGDFTASALGLPVLVDQIRCVILDAVLGLGRDVSVSPFDLEVDLEVGLDDMGDDTDDFELARGYAGGGALKGKYESEKGGF